MFAHKNSRVEPARACLGSTRAEIKNISTDIAKKYEMSWSCHCGKHHVMLQITHAEVVSMHKKCDILH